MDLYDLRIVDAYQPPEDAIHHPPRYPLGRDSSADLEARGY
jgi:hypothetical protein